MSYTYNKYNAAPKIAPPTIGACVLIAPELDVALEVLEALLVADLTSLLALLTALDTADDALAKLLLILPISALIELLTALSVAVFTTELKLEISLLA